MRGEILEKTIQDATASALTDNELRPALQPKIEIVTFEEGADLEYKLQVEVLPEIEPADFSSFELERLIADVEDSEIETALQRLSEQRKTFQVVETPRPAQIGDQLTIDFTGRVDGETFDGGTASDFLLELGSNQFLPVFDDQLVGVELGAKVEVKLDFPNDYPAENLKGKNAVFEVDVKEVSESVAVAVDNELARAMGVDDLNARSEISGLGKRGGDGVLVADKVQGADVVVIPERLEQAVDDDGTAAIPAHHIRRDSHNDSAASRMAAARI